MIQLVCKKVLPSLPALVSAFQSLTDWQIQLEEQLRLRTRVFTVTLLLLTLIYAATLVFLVTRHTKSLRRKEAGLARIIQALLEKHFRMETGPDCVEETPEGFVSGTEEALLFLRMDRIVDQNRLFTQSDLSRDILAGIMGVDRNRFARIIRVHGGVKNMSEYLNRKRMAFVVEVMKTHPYYTLEAISRECGFSSTTTFNRVFREFFGQSPSEFRKKMGR